jgi:hypothetical protein
LKDQPSIMGSDEKEPEKETDPALPKPPANTDQITAVIGKSFGLEISMAVFVSGLVVWASLQLLLVNYLVWTLLQQLMASSLVSTSHKHGQFVGLDDISANIRMTFKSVYKFCFK